MKKLIMLIAAVAMASVASATNVAWGLTSGQALDTAKFTDGSMMYLVYGASFDATSSYWSNQSSFSFATITSAGGAKYDEGAMASGTYMKSGLAMTPTSTGLGTGSKNFYYVVISDDGQYAALSTAQSINITNSPMNLSKTISASSFTTYTAAAPVPEPTSGLLMLVGLGVLALRRKRA